MATATGGDNSDCCEEAERALGAHTCVHVSTGWVLTEKIGDLARGRSLPAVGTFATMPKVELHLHLEGAIPLPAMWELVQRHGGDPEVPTAEALSERYRYRDFPHFIETWVWKNRYLDSYEAFEFAAEAVAGELGAAHIVYAEAFFSPTDFRRHDLTPDQLAVAIRRGLDRVDGVEVALIVDLVRETGPARAAETFARIQEVAEEAGVVGVGIGGSEVGYPPEPFADVYRQAREEGFRLTAHAGESAGPESIWGALRSLGVERIGHGIRSVEDAELVRYLVEHRLPLEICPTSNLRTGVVSAWDEHPIRALIDAGAAVTINTDDPAMFDCTLAGEYQNLADRFGYDDDVIRRLAYTSIEASWAAPASQRRLRGLLDVWWAERR